MKLMQFTVLLMLLIAAKESRSQLLCYVCDSCSTITEKTPMQPCDQDSFSEHGSTMLATMTTTTQRANDWETPRPTTVFPAVIKDDMTTLMSTTMSNDTTTIIMSTTDSPSTLMPMTDKPTTTTEYNSTNATMMTTNMNPIASTSTGSSLETTTFMPTTLNNGTVVIRPLNYSTVVITPSSDEPLNDEDDDKPLAKSSQSYMSSSTFRGRQVRNIVPDSMTYYCFAVQKKHSNESYTVQRGCSASRSNDTICTQLKATNNHTINKCDTCSKNLCNGSTALRISIIALVLGVALILVKN